MRPLIVGQAPGPRTDPREPLSGASGRRLAALCGLTIDQFLDAFERINLVRSFHGKAGKGDAFDRWLVSARLLRRLRRRGGPVVLLGRNVAAAFGVDGLPLLRWHGNIAVVPHPSGINHWWNYPANVRRARRFWRKLARS